MKQHNPHRISRINDLVHQQLMVILRRESNDPRLNKLNVTGVEVSRDLGVAKIFYTDDLSSALININSDNKTNNKTNNKNNLLQKSLEKASGFLRRELARRCDLRKTPELRFIYDKSIDQGSKIEGILRSVKLSSSDLKSESKSSLDSNSDSDSGSSEQD
jgi:ribosome-binding factor A